MNVWLVDFALKKTSIKKKERKMEQSHSVWNKNETGKHSFSLKLSALWEQIFIQLFGLQAVKRESRQYLDSNPKHRKLPIYPCKSFSSFPFLSLWNELKFHWTCNKAKQQHHELFNFSQSLCVIVLCHGICFGEFLVVNFTLRVEH
jgi:hypothetical protein